MVLRVPDPPLMVIIRLEAVRLGPRKLVFSRNYTTGNTSRPALLPAGEDDSPKRRLPVQPSASPTVSPNWHLDNARYLQRAHSGGSSFPLSSIIKSRSRSHARAVSSSSSAWSSAFWFRPGRVFCSPSWTLPTSAIQHPPVSSSLTWRRRKGWLHS